MDSTRVYTWTTRFKYGFGRTPRERLISDLALLLDLHGVDVQQEADALMLAEFLAGVLEARNPERKTQTRRG